MRNFLILYAIALASVLTCAALGLIQGNNLLSAVGAFGLLAIEVTTLIDPELAQAP